MTSERHFTIEELCYSEAARNAGISNDPTPEHRKNLESLIKNLEVVRKILGGYPIKINSGYRNPQVNKLVGGVKSSAHAKGYAADFVCSRSTLTPKEQCKLLAEKLENYDQIILERNGTLIHISFDPRNRKENLSQPGGPGTKFYLGFI